ncbi:DegT/DnrJ/EryC1/StrS family aminotransferase [Anaerovibrio slackiae]|nr:DegT/DnrJ/EryC1/StrS family aminotransferase [Anaerovibrio slackiae]
MIHDNWNDINGDDIKNVSEYMRNESLACIDGGVLKKFEDDFACYIGTKYAVAYSSGTAAIYAAVRP